MRVEAYTTADLPADVARGVAALQSRIWPNPDRTEESLVRGYAETGAAHTGTEDLSPAHYVVLEDDRVVATAQTFPRTVVTQGGERTVLALAAVCTDPASRRKGLGAAVVRAAFARVDKGLFPLCLFQTTSEVRPFYEKLGARAVDNRFVDSIADDPEANPLWDPEPMIYPAAADWPDGTVDLRGGAW
jgi:predicted N-acetyltransferase YhbS